MWNTNVHNANCAYQIKLYAYFPKNILRDIVSTTEWKRKIYQKFRFGDLLLIFAIEIIINNFNLRINAEWTNLLVLNIFYEAPITNIKK